MKAKVILLFLLTASSIFPQSIWICQEVDSTDEDWNYYKGILENGYSYQQDDYNFFVARPPLEDLIVVCFKVNKAVSGNFDEKTSGYAFLSTAENSISLVTDDKLNPIEKFKSFFGGSAYPEIYYDDAYDFDKDGFIEIVAHGSEPLVLEGEDPNSLAKKFENPEEAREKLLQILKDCEESGSICEMRFSFHSVYKLKNGKFEEVYFKYHW